MKVSTSGLRKALAVGVIALSGINGGACASEVTGLYRKQLLVALNETLNGRCPTQQVGAGCEHNVGMKHFVYHLGAIVSIRYTGGWNHALGRVEEYSVRFQNDEQRWLIGVNVAGELFLLSNEE